MIKKPTLPTYLQICPNNLLNKSLDLLVPGSPKNHSIKNQPAIKQAGFSLIYFTSILDKHYKRGIRTVIPPGVSPYLPFVGSVSKA